MGVAGQLEFVGLGGEDVVEVDILEDGVAVAPVEDELFVEGAEQFDAEVGGGFSEDDV